MRLGYPLIIKMLPFTQYSHILPIIFFSQFVTSQYQEITENGDFIVTCPGVPGTLNINGGPVDKPLKFTNPSSASSCLTENYGCQDIGANFNCIQNAFVALCPLGQMSNFTECIETPAGFYKSGATFADSVKL